MSVKQVRALVITGDGINSEEETALALRLAGFQTDIRHLNDLIAERFSFDALSLRYGVVALPGGFSFGDDLSSGKLLALKIQHGLGWNLQTYADRGGLVIGICNGFQALIRMGIFGKDLSITQNKSGQFLNTWVKVSPKGNRSVWLKGIGTIDLPIRHGEGRIVFEMSHKQEVLRRLDRYSSICLKYELNPNGSDEDVAGFCDPTGRIIGLMPHPEGFVRWTQHPEWTMQPNRSGAPGQGLALFDLLRLKPS